MPLAVETGRNKFESPVLSNIYVLPDIRSDIYFEIVGPTAFLSVRTDGPTVFGKSVIGVDKICVKFINTFIIVIKLTLTIYLNSTHL